jgi:hypothetical protein
MSSKPNEKRLKSHKLVICRGKASRKLLLENENFKPAFNAIVLNSQFLLAKVMETKNL